MEKEMETHTKILAWEIPWTEEPGGSQKSRTLLSDQTATTVKGQNKGTLGKPEGDTICCTCCEQQSIPDHIVDCHQELSFTELLFPHGFKFIAVASVL